MTPTLARLVGARADSLKRPVKWFNIGEHYRYERPQKGGCVFYQFNADILVSPSGGRCGVDCLISSDLAVFWFGGR